MPVVIRIDGKAFHTYTHGFEKPFDAKIVGAMQATTKFLCENIQNCVLGYTQSDEISLLLIDYKKLDTCAWFDNELQKIVSVAASMATMKFNQLMEEKPTAVFDARAFNIPREEVCNYFIWRQRDGIRNGVNSFARSIFSTKQLQGKNVSEVKEMCYKAGHEYNYLDKELRLGSIYRKYGDKFSLNSFVFSEDRAYVDDLLEPEED